MAVDYDGPYRNDLNRDGHGGWVARLLPDHTLTGWTGPDKNAIHIGLVGVCDCGWRCDTTRPPADFGSEPFELAEHDVWTQHLQPLIAAAQQRFWPAWHTATVALVDQIAGHGDHRRLGDAKDLLDQLADEAAHRGRLVGELLAEGELANPAADGDHGRVGPDPAGRSFPRIATPPAVSAPVVPTPSHAAVALPAIDPPTVNPPQPHHHR